MDDKKHELGDVVKETFKEIGRGVVALSKILGERALYIGESTLFFNLAPYAIPTVVMEIKKEKDNQRAGEYRPTYKYDLFTELGSLFLPAATMVGHGWIYAAHPKLLAVPIATNTISAFYEAYKSAKQRMDIEG